MNILGFFPNFALVEFRTKWIRIKRGLGVSIFSFTKTLGICTFWIRCMKVRYLSSSRNHFPHCVQFEDDIESFINKVLLTPWRCSVYQILNIDWYGALASVSLGSGIKVNYPQLSLESDRYTMMDRLFRSLFCFPWSWL